MTSTVRKLEHLQVYHSGTEGLQHCRSTCRGSAVYVANGFSYSNIQEHNLHYKVDGKRHRIVLLQSMPVTSIEKRLKGPGYGRRSTV